MKKLMFALLTMIFLYFVYDYIDASKKDKFIRNIEPGITTKAILLDILGPAKNYSGHDPKSDRKYSSFLYLEGAPSIFHGRFEDHILVLFDNKDLVLEYTRIGL